jgi:hypothetical protein
MKPLLVVMSEKIGSLPGIALPAYGLMGAKCFAKFWISGKGFDAGFVSLDTNSMFYVWRNWAGSTGTRGSSFVTLWQVPTSNKQRKMFHEVS